MPAEFKDDAMRNFFRGKFEEFINGSNGHHRKKVLSECSSSVIEKADFAEEHTERRKCELEYVRSVGAGFAKVEEADVVIESSTGNHENLIDDDSSPVTDNFSTLHQDNREFSCSLFKREWKELKNTILITEKFAY